MRNLIVTFMVSVMACNAIAGTFSISEKEHAQMKTESEDWMDDMPDGIQDRLSDAVSHAMQGVTSEIEYFRSYTDKNIPVNNSVTVKDIQGGESGDIPMRIYTPKKTLGEGNILLIYFHGGGWSLGSLDTHDNYCRSLVSEGNINVVSVDYPLAPENPYPKAVEYAVKAIGYIKDKSADWFGSQQNISLGGDGAGGNIILETIGFLPKNLSIQSLVLYYPLLNFTGTLDPVSKRKYGRGYGFDSRLWEAFNEAYGKGKDKIFLLNPPVLLISAGQDLIIEEEKNFSSSDSNITYIEFTNSIHGFISDNHQPTALKKAIDLTIEFLKSN